MGQIPRIRVRCVGERRLEIGPRVRIALLHVHPAETQLRDGEVVTVDGGRGWITLPQGAPGTSIPVRGDFPAPPEGHRSDGAT